MRVVTSVSCWYPGRVALRLGVCERVLGTRACPWGVRVPPIGIRPCGLLGVRPYGLWTLPVWRRLICARTSGSDYQDPEDQSTPPIPQVPQCPRLSRAWIIGGFTINPEVTSHGSRAGANAIVRYQDSGGLAWEERATTRGKIALP